MANGAKSTPGLTFPKRTFAKLTPGPYLHAHLKQAGPRRPNGRTPDEFRQPLLNTGSLTHSNGSAVVRCGDTAVVCGIRAEVLLASDVARPPSEDLDDSEMAEELGLIVPNVELSTGCAPAHLPGNPPTTLAQSLSYRTLSLLHNAKVLNLDDLKIEYLEPKQDDNMPDAGPDLVTKAYWVLYIDVLCMSLDGNAFDTIWAAILASLQNTVLPKAWWDPDREMILCSPVAADSRKLRFNDLPAAATFAVFSTASPLRQPDFAESWILADPDTIEEELASEVLTVTLSSKRSGQPRVVSLEKSGGTVINVKAIESCIRLAEARRDSLLGILDQR